MSTQHIVSMLIEERARLQAAIDALKGTPESGVPDWVGRPAPVAQLAHSDRMKEIWRKRKAAAVVTPKKRILSAEGRQRIIKATKARWAKRRAAVAESVAPIRETSRARIAEANAPKEDQEFKARMSAAMTMARAKRKRAAKKKRA